MRRDKYGDLDREDEDEFDRLQPEDEVKELNMTLDEDRDLELYDEDQDEDWDDEYDDEDDYDDYQDDESDEDDDYDEDEFFGEELN